MSDDDVYIEVKYSQKNHFEARICGDVFISRHVLEEGRVVVVLSDGMGHGVKANVLATLTATMALNFTVEHKENRKIAEMIMNTLPVCSIRQISYATFTILDIDKHGPTRILEFDNPGLFILRAGELLDPEWEEMELTSGQHMGKRLRTCSFQPVKGDRMVFCSDGVTQSGMGSDALPFGWGEDGLRNFVQKTVQNDPDIDADKLAIRVVNAANKHDAYLPHDDISCVSIYFREPRKLLYCTGPPYEEERDQLLGEAVREFNGKKIVSGATTGDIIARELGVEIKDGFEFTDDDLPPISYMEGVDLYTEGILTLGKVASLLPGYLNKVRKGKGPADQVIRLLLDSDEITFIIGTRVNVAHQDPNLPMELEIRRTVVKRIAAILEKEYLKRVIIRYI
jgi:hypothetical protein